MELERREYEYVRKIVETGSFKEAAEKLYITQPSLSQFIRHVESRLGVELFDRSHQPVRLTEAGQIYLETEKQINELYKKRKQRIQDLHHEVSGNVCIGSSPYRSSTILARAIPVINARYPQVEICLEEGTTRDLEEFALQGKTDFSIVVKPTVPTSLEYIELFHEELLLAIAPQWHLGNDAVFQKVLCSAYPVFDYRKLSGRPFLVMKEGQELRRAFFSFIESLAICPPIALETTDMATAHTLAGIGVGAAIVPRGLVTSSKPAVQPEYFSLRAYLDDWNVVLAYKKGQYFSRADQAVIDIICEMTRSK